MKLFRNPIVVGVLALCAVVVMAIQFGPHFMPSSSPPRPNTSAPPPPAPTPTAQPVASAPQQKAPPGASIDIQAVESNSVRWHNNILQKDPFQTRNSSTQSTNPPAQDVLKLNAVWRQTQLDLAVINNHVVVVGDRVLDFRIFSIEPDSVWVDGSNGREQVVFPSAAPKRTNAAPPAVNPRP